MALPDFRIKQLDMLTICKPLILLCNQSVQHISFLAHSNQDTGDSNSINGINVLKLLNFYLNSTQLLLNFYSLRTL